MFNFFYDSLETVQKLKFPTREEYIQMGLFLLLAILLAGAIFAIYDAVISNLYLTFYQLFRG